MSKELSPKKKAIAELSTKLSNALPELKTTLGDKKFDRRIRKAAKLLNAGLKFKPTAADVENVSIEAKA